MNFVFSKVSFSISQITYKTVFVSFSVILVSYLYHHSSRSISQAERFWTLLGKSKNKVEVERGIFRLAVVERSRRVLAILIQNQERLRHPSQRFQGEYDNLTEMQRRRQHG